VTLPSAGMHMPWAHESLMCG